MTMTDQTESASEGPCEVCGELVKGRDELRGVDQWQVVRETIYRHRKTAECIVANAALRAELAAARENEARWLWMFPDDATVSVTERMQRVYRKWDGCDSWNAAVDAARRAGGEG